MAGSNRWARLDVGYFENTKIARVSTPAMLLHLASILHCVDQLTDGEVSARALDVCSVRARASTRKAPERAAELVAAGLWIPTEHGWHLHDFESMNPQAMRKIVERDRAAARERQRRYRGGDVTP
jgi:hypothetical protein